MNRSANPWRDRFSPILNLESIKEKTLVRVEPLRGLDIDLIEEAADRIKDAWETTFYPTNRACQIMLEVVQSAASHATRHHPDHKTHLARAYQEEVAIEPYVPMMLWGPAGTGKSQLGKALLRLFPEPSFVDFPAGHGPMPLVAIRAVRAQGNNSVASILKQLAPDTANNSKVADLYCLSARYQYNCGVCCLLVDELQFFTQSKGANTLLTQLLLALSYVRVPYVVIANYSLAHRLKHRNSEELQRIMGRPIVLLPDGPETEDWRAVLNEYQRVVPGIFEFSFDDCAATLWSLCVGLKRVLVRLLVLSYKKARIAERFKVTWADVEFAYASIEFSTYRSEVEILILHGMSSPALKEDLRCPFPIPPTEAEKYHAALHAARLEKLAEAAFRSSITVSERRAADFVNAATNGHAEAKFDVPQKTTKRNQKRRTAESIKAAGERFRKSI
jgi:hypothetical protein